MGMTADLKLYKSLLIIIDIVFLICGILLIALGSWAFTDYVEGVSGENFAVGLIILGCIATLVSLIGCIGAMKENRGALKIYAGAVLVLMIIQIALGIAAYVLRDQIPSYAEDSWSNMGDKGREDLENVFNCCGWYNSSDMPSNSTNCPIENANSSVSGCESAIVNEIDNSLVAIGVTAIVIGVLELLVVLFSCCLIQRIPSKEDREAALLEEARRLERDNNQPQPNYTTAGYPAQK